MFGKHSNIHVRLTTADDAGSVSTVLREAAAEYETFYTPDAFAATTPTTDLLPKRWCEGPSWIALQAGHVDRDLATCRAHLPSLAPAPYGRHSLRQEPDAGDPYVRICEEVSSNRHPYSDSRKGKLGIINVHEVAMPRD